jgi:hypothetical protein
MIKQYKIENNKLITGSGKTLLDGFTEFTTTIDENGVEVFPVEMQPYLEAERLEEAKQSQLSEAKEYLNSTDWIVVKINEAQVLGNDIQPLLEKHTVELAKRLEARDTINSLEG